MPRIRLFRAVLVWVLLIGLLFNQISNPAAVLAQQKNCGAYVVKAGETISILSLRLDISHVGLVQANNLLDSNNNEKPIRAGMTLILPCELPSPGLPAQVHHIKVNQPKTASGGKSIYVSIAKQRAYVYEGDSLVYTFVISTALPQYGTKRGTFRVKSKMPEAYSSRWQLKMPNWLGIYDAGPSENGFHALPINKRGQRLWAGLLGRPASFGCIILSTRDAATLYNWAEIGTTVVIR